MMAEMGISRGRVMEEMRDWGERRDGDGTPFSRDYYTIFKDH